VFYNLLHLFNNKKETMKKKATPLLLLLITVLVLTSCGTVKDNALYTKKSRWVPGNAKAFQQRHNAKMKADSLKNISVIKH
jgi:putative N-acetylmannosamine-6-phosphate epimerase